MSRRTDSLYAIIDAETTERPLELARAALHAGCALLQLRAKRLDDRSFLELGFELRAECSKASTPFVVNDRADIARILAADGLHLGQDDLELKDARRVVGDLQIGISTHSLSQAERAEKEGADLIAFGPVFETRSKENPDPVVGLQRLARVREAVSTPLVAIGGINTKNADETLRAGANYIAVISALPEFLRAD